MAGMRGNVAWWAWGKQSGRASAAAAAQYQAAFTGGSLSPERNTSHLAETDASREVGTTYVTSTGAGGAPQAYARDSFMHSLLEGALGTKVDTGTLPNYVHTVTPSNALSYYTFWKMLGGSLWERFEDCMISDLQISTTAGAPLDVTATIMGRQAIRLTSDPSPSWTGPPVVAIASDQVYTYNDCVVTLAGGVSALVSSFDLTITNNVQVQQTDAVIPYDLQAGQRTISLGFELIFEDLNEYNKFYYGGVAGTTANSTIYTTSADFNFSHGANNGLDFNIPSLAYEQFPVAPDVSGNAVRVAVRAQAQRPAPTMTAIVKNQLAT